MLLNIHRNHKAYQGEGKGEERGMGVGEEGHIYLSLYTVTTRMTPASRWSAMRAEVDSNQSPSAYQQGWGCGGGGCSVCVCVCVCMGWWW